MPLLHIKSLVPFGQGDNSTDVVINDNHFNLTTLNYWNYTLYSNGTLSNGSDCYLAFNGYKPNMFSNGTFANVTSCYTPIHEIGRRGTLGLAFALAFAITILFTMANLRKHGTRYLPLEKRRSLVGRRWKWYWLLFVTACGTISCFMSVDVDRDYLQNSPIILQSIFYTLIMPGLMAAIWEAVRHWGSWQERQIRDRDILAFTEPGNSNTREMQELILPLIFYAFACLNFFLTIPRSWTPIQLQRSDLQTTSEAEPTATDGRFKAAAFVTLGGVLVTLYSLEHSIYRYIPRPGGQTGRAALSFYITSAPSQFLVAIAFLLIKIAYGIVSSFVWTLSPYNADVHPAWLYGLGYTPALLIILLFNLCGFCEINEDKQILIARGERISTSKYKFKRKKPAWMKPPRRMAKIFSPDRKVTEEEIGFVEMGDMKQRLPDEKNLTADVTVSSRSQSTSDDIIPISDDIRDPENMEYIERVVHGLHAENVEGEDGGGGRDRNRSQLERRSTESTAAGDESQSPQTVRSMLDV